MAPGPLDVKRTARWVASTAASLAVAVTIVRFAYGSRKRQPDPH